MSKTVTTPRKHEYLLSDDVYDRVSRVDGGSGRLWVRLNAAVEYSEAVPGLFGFLAILVMIFFRKQLPWATVASIAIIAKLIGYLVSRWVKVYAFAPLTVLCRSYLVLSRYCMPQLAVILLAGFIFGNWMLAVVYFAAGLLFARLTGDPVRKIPFNDKLARGILSLFEEAARRERAAGYKRKAKKRK